MKILHILRTDDDKLAERMIADIRSGGGNEQTLLLIHDGVYAQSLHLPAFACSEDVRARGIQTDVPLVGYYEIADMVFAHDKVMTW